MILCWITVDLACQAGVGAFVDLIGLAFQTINKSELYTLQDPPWSIAQAMIWPCATM